MSSQEKGKTGQSFDAFLEEEGLLEESTQQAIQRVSEFIPEQTKVDQNNKNSPGDDCGPGL